MYRPFPDAPHPDEEQRWVQLRQQNVETWIDLVHLYLPDLSDEAADFVLWEKTSFPTGMVQKIEFELRRLAEGRMI